jgi:hypothetical protein
MDKSRLTETFKRIGRMAAIAAQMTSIIMAIVTFALILGPTTTTQTQSTTHEVVTVSAPEDLAGVIITTSPVSVVSHRWDASPMPIERLAELDEQTLPIPECEWTEKARTALTRMIQIESPRDVLPIAWTMSRRWRAIGRHRGTNFADYVVETSRPLRVHRRVTERGLISDAALHASGLTRHQVLAVTDRLENRNAIAGELDLWALGTQPDPCNGASFMWSAPSFQRSVKRVDCGNTSNRFFELPRGSHARYVARLDDPIVYPSIDACPVLEGTAFASASPPTPP